MTLPASGPISLNDLALEFGYFGADQRLGDYYRGGARVPNIAANAAVPTSGVISLSNFYGARPDLTDRLSSWWEFEGASSPWADSRGNNNVSGTGALGAGAVGQAIKSALVQKVTPVGMPSTTEPGSYWTFGAWYMKAGTSNTLALRVSGSSGDCFGLSNANGAFSVGGSGTVYRTHAPMTMQTTWTFIIGWYNGTSINFCANDGAPITAAASTSPRGSITNIILETGTDVWIDQVFIYNRALSQGERSLLWNSGFGRTYASLAGS